MSDTQLCGVWFHSSKREHLTAASFNMFLSKCDAVRPYKAVRLPQSYDRVGKKQSFRKRGKLNKIIQKEWQPGGNVKVN